MWTSRCALGEPRWRHGAGRVSGNAMLSNRSPSPALLSVSCLVSVLLAVSAGCNSRRFIAGSDDGVGVAWHDNGSDLVPPAPGDETASAPDSTGYPAGGSSGRAPGPASSSPLLPDVGTSSAGDGVGGAWVRTDEARSTLEGETILTGVTASVSSSASSAPLSVETPSEGSPSSGPGPTQTTQPEATDRDALIAALLGCEPGSKVTFGTEALADFEGVPDEALTTGRLVLGSQQLAAVLADYQDHTGDYELSWVTGANGSARALRASNPVASAWGGGISIVSQCFDAGTFEGIEFWMKGETPVGTISFSVDTIGGSAAIQLDIGPNWTRHRVPFGQLQQDAPGSFDGRAIASLVWSSQLRYVERPPRSGNWEAQPGAFAISVDDVRFY